MAGGIRRAVLKVAAPAAALVVLASPAAALAQDARPFLIPAEGVDAEFTPLLSSGDMIGDYQMAAVPDGLGLFKEGDKAVLYVNHELTTEDDENLSGSRISRLVLDPATGEVLEGRYVVDGAEGYERFCSGFLAGEAQGFDAPVFLTGEETTERGKGGMAIAVDGASGAVTELPWLGYFAHENLIALPGFAGKTVILGTDDDSSGSELYMYVADSPSDLMAGRGQLMVLKGNDAVFAGELAKDGEIAGAFIPVDQKDNADAASLQSFVAGAGALRFIRLEDAAYNRDTPNVIYLADTGDNEDPNLTADGTPYNANGRIYELTLDPADPTSVLSLKVLLDGDAGDPIRNPDNLETADGVLVIQEDRNSYNRIENSEDTGSIFAYDLAGATLTKLAQIDQSDGEGLVDEGDKAGSWESSGIIDASEVFGPGAWLTSVQAHSIKTPQFGGEDEGGQILLVRMN